jgi:hypothetical protein
MEIILGIQLAVLAAFQPFWSLAHPDTIDGYHGGSGGWREKEKYVTPHSHNHSHSHSCTGEKRDWQTMAYEYSHFDKDDQLDWAERDLESKQRHAGLEVADGSSAIAFDDDDDKMFSSRWGEHSAR